MDTARMAMLGRIGGRTTVVKHGGRAMTSAANAAKEARRRAEAIELGAVTEAEIAEKVAAIKKLEGAKLTYARTMKRRQRGK